MATTSRTLPAPYDIILDGDPFMLDTDGQNNLVYEQTKMQFIRNVVTPGAQPYATADPRLEAPRGFFQFSNGMGFREEDPQVDRDTNGYYYGLYIDSDGKSIVNGPQVTSVTPTLTGAGKQFFEFTVGGTRKLCLVTATNVLIRDADSAAGWVQSRVLTSGSRAAVFRGTQSGDFAFIAEGTAANFWTWDGANNFGTWTQHSTEHAIDFEVDVDKMWILSRDTGGATNGYTLRVTYNGGATPSIGGRFIISELANPATDMAMFNDRLFVGTERGLFAPSLEAMEEFDYKVENLTPAFAFQRNADNGKGLTPWYEWLMTPMAGGLFRYSSDGSFTEFGLGTLQDNRSEVQGIPTAGCGYRNWTYFQAFYNAVEDASYLMRWGNWQWVETSNGPQRVFIPGWHGALYKLAGARIDAMIVTEVTGGPRLYFADDNGDIHYIILPRYSMSWQSDSACRYNTTTAGEVYFPTIHHGVRFEPKANLAISMTVENLSGTTRYIDATYRLAPTAAFGGASNLDANGRFNTDPGQRLNFNTDVSSRMTDILATLTTTTAATPCILRSIALYQNVRPTYKWIYVFAVRLSQDVIGRSGLSTRRFFDESAQVDSLEASGSTASPVTLVTPRGESISVLVTDLKMKAKNRRNTHGPLEWTAYVEAMQHSSLSVLGTWASFGRYTWAYVYNFTWSQVENL